MELEHKAYWAIKTLNLNYTSAGEKQILDIHELEELRLDAYENAKIYKERTKKWHDKHISRKEFNVSDVVLLFNSSFHAYLDLFECPQSSIHQDMSGGLEKLISQFILLF